MSRPTGGRSSDPNSLPTPHDENSSKLRSALSPTRRLSKSISSLKHGKSKPRPNELPSEDDILVPTQDDNEGDLARSKYMMKSIVGLLTTASVYAGIDNAQEANELGQELIPEDHDVRDEISSNEDHNSAAGSHQIMGNHAESKTGDVGKIDASKPASRKPTLFSFSVVPTSKLEGSAELGLSKQQARKKIITKLLKQFKLDDSENLIKEFSVWLLKDVLVQGKLLLTSRYLLFFAYLPKSPGTVKFSGNLNIRSALRASTRYWCVLKDHTLSLYSSPTEVYFPVLTIDLRNATSIHLEKKVSSDGSDKIFKITSNEKSYTFIADTDYSARTWCNVLKKQQFAAQNTENDSVSLKIPLANIIDIDDQAIVNQALTVRIRALESTHSFAIDDFLFVFLDGSGFSLIGLIKERLSELSGLGTRILLNSIPLEGRLSTSYKSDSNAGGQVSSFSEQDDSSNIGESLKSHNPLIVQPFQSPPAHSVSEKHQEGKSWRKRIRSKSGSWLSKTAASDDPGESVVVEYYTKSQTKPGGASPQNIPESQSSDSEEVGRESRRSKLAGWTTKPFKNVAEMWSAHPMHYANDYIPFSDDDPYLVKSKDKASASQRFRSHFKLSDDVTLISASFTYLVRNVPLYGKLYLANGVMCFRTLLPRINTKMILPLNDVETCYKEKGFRFGYLGLVVVIRGHEELFFEFSTASARDDAEYILLKRLDEMKSQRKAPATAITNVVETDANTAKLKFFEDKINAEGFEVPLLIDENPCFQTNITPTRTYNIGMLTIGSRGDVQPYIALGKGLIKEGHQVTIITHGEFRDFIVSHGIGFEELAGNPADLMALMVEHESMNVGLLRDASSRFRDWITSLLDTSWEACKKLDLDILIESPSAMAGIHIAEALKIPYFRAFTMPWTRTRAYPHAFIVPDQKRGGNYNYLTHVLFENIFWKGVSGQVNKWRVESLGLERTNLELLQQNKVPFFYNVSPTIFPPSVDFSEWIKVTGYWFLDEKNDYEPPVSLTAFISTARKRNKKLVYIGFGSIVVSNAKEMTKAITAAVEEADVYCILNKGWSERLNDVSSKEVEIDLPECIFNAGNVPHDWLFPQMDAAVHHGGSGTTGATLRAGLPTIVKPFFGDQFFYALRVEDIGTGIALKKLNSASLAQALKEVTTNKRMLDRALLIKNQISNEDGVRTAINCLYGELEYARSLVNSKNNKTKSAAAAAAAGEAPLSGKYLSTTIGNDIEEAWTLL